MTQNTNNTYYLPSQTTTADDYYLINKVLVYSNNLLQGEAEKVTHSKINLLNSSLLTTPSLTYPAYTQEGGIITLFPATIVGANDVQSQYIRYPKPPKWTYLTVSSGDPVFNQSATDYQDFELSPDDETSLVFKILQYAGMSIREISAAEFGVQQENMENQDEN